MELDDGLKTLHRLDAYLPALNTGFMDGRIQDVIIQHPLVRALVVPEADMEARRRCIRLAGRIVDAATPVLPLILQEYEGSDLSKMRADGNAGGPGGEQFRVPELSLDAQSRLMTALASLAEKDPLIQFWVSHHITSRSFRRDSNGGGSSGGGASKRDSSSGGTGSQDTKSTVNLYLRVKQAHRGLADLADRKQGAVCKAFWDLWDENYVAFGEIVGADALEATERGRLFRPAGEAAIYINNHKVSKKRKVKAQERRQSFAGTTAANATGGSGFTFSSAASGSHVANAGPAPMSPPKSSGSPESVTMADIRPTPGSGGPSSNPGNDGGVYGGRGSVASAASAQSDASLPLIDVGDIDYIIHEAYAGNTVPGANGTHAPGDELMDVFTNIPAASSPNQHQHQQQQHNHHNLTVGSAPAGGSSHLDLRQRIKMMEEGQSLDEPPAAAPTSTIIW